MRKLRMRVMYALTAAGERLGVRWLVYNPLVFLMFDEYALASAPGVLRTFERLFPAARRLADVGAGSGGFAAHARSRGYEVLGCEHSSFGRWLASRKGVTLVPFDLNRTPPVDEVWDVDLAYCFEVAEHLEPDLGDRLVQMLATMAPTVVFTAADPGQGGTGHVNEQPPAYWHERFQRHGMRHRADLSEAVAESFRAEKVPAWWLAKNVSVYERLAGGGRGVAEADGERGMDIPLGGQAGPTA